jgi:hypothetical protein
MATCPISVASFRPATPPSCSAKAPSMSPVGVGTDPGDSSSPYSTTRSRSDLRTPFVAGSARISRQPNPPLSLSSADGQALATER